MAEKPEDPKSASKWVKHLCLAESEVGISQEAGDFLGCRDALLRVLAGFCMVIDIQVHDHYHSDN